MSAKLLPCPFCGSEPEKVYKSNGQTTHIECPNCKAQFPKSTMTNRYDDVWNTRAERTCKNANMDGYGFRFECCECGYSTIVHNCAVRLDELPTYCPNCGARRVDE